MNLKFTFFFGNKCNMYLNFTCVILIFYFTMGKPVWIYNKLNHKKNKVKCGIQYGDPEPLDSYIMGGTKAEIMQFPWMVAIMSMLEGQWEAMCGATLISSKFVVSAAHCFYDPKGKLQSFDEFRLLLGVQHLQKNESFRQDLFMKKVILHDMYDWAKGINDICLIQLPTPINFRNTLIRPICLPQRYDPNKLYYENAIVAGWGMAENGFSQHLLFVCLPVANKTACIKELMKQNFNNEHLFESALCTINPGDGRDACAGDSGGPLMGIRKKTKRVYLRGVVSFGSNVCNGFGGYSKISYFLDWICNTVKRTRMSINKHRLI